MRLYEYQAKELLAKAGIPVPEGVLVRTPEEAERAAKRWADGCVVKAQVHAGGRGKAGGVRLCANPDEARQAAAALLGKPLITAQTGPEGERVHAVRVEARVAIEREIYFAIVLDRAQKGISAIVSAEGGMEIEQLARTRPQAIYRTAIAPDEIFPKDDRFLKDILNGDEKIKELAHVMRSMTKLFWEKDCILLEINPLAKTSNQGWFAADAKMIVDDNALFRHPDLARWMDEDVRDALELKARKAGLSYIHLTGEIGCVVNGAGLAMATMDLIRLHGGRPANFLDIGGGASLDAMREGFALLFGDAQVKAVLVNIFGGIVRCDLVAEALVAAMQTSARRLPVVLRLVGTNEAQGRKIIEQAGIPVRWEHELDRAARAAVELAR